MPTKHIISASRRTDIPAFYMDWFMERIERGRFRVRNPFNRRESIVHATPEEVHCIVFWSKDFSRFLEGGYGRRLEQMGYNLFFLFTVNSKSSLLEPNIPSIDARMEQATQLATRYGPQSVWWRFDPICFYKYGNEEIHNNLADFPRIAGQMADIGIERCITSFVDIYAKVARRTKDIPGFSFVDPDMAKKIRVLGKMADLLEPINISLYTCCENDVMAALGEHPHIAAGGCISGRYLADRFKTTVSFEKDSGQRREKGCQCTISKDIGCYEAHPCDHHCLFCYAGK